RVLADRSRDVTVHDLPVVDVELQPEVRLPDLVNDRPRLAGVVQKIAWNVARVDRLYDHLHPELLRHTRRFSQVRDVRRARGAVVDEASHGVNAGTFQRLGIAERLA